MENTEDISRDDMDEIVDALDASAATGLPWMPIADLAEAAGWGDESAAQDVVDRLVDMGEVERSFRDGDDMYRIPGAADTRTGLQLSVEVTRQPEVLEDGNLVASLCINGTDFHATFMPARGSGDAQRVSHASGNETRFEALSVFEDEGPGFETIHMQGRDYVCVITPFHD